jgi:exonuclease SbcD
MKILHTSDWHLGQYFLGKSRQNEHKQFLDWLLVCACENQVDAIIVAGDIFDTGSPPSYARELYNQFVEDLQATKIKLIIIGGNHDSVATLGESKGLLKLLNTFVIPGVMSNQDEQVITLTDKNKQPIAMICAVPFLRARDLQFSQAGLSGKQKQASLQQAITEHYQGIYDLAKAQRKVIGKKIPIIATGHLATVGAKTSDSVRDIYIGTLESFSSNNFPPADYIALGHIHRAQKVGKTEHIRYCGSPITLSFDELNSTKKVLLVEFEEDKLQEIKEINIPCFQQLKQIKGDLAEIEKKLDDLDSKLEGNIWLDIEVSTEDYLGDLHQRIESMVADKPLEVLKLRRKKQQKLKSLGQVEKETLQELTPLDVLNQRLAEEQWDSKEQKKLKKQITKAFNSIVEDLHENP